jgi:hypothetical protein
MSYKLKAMHALRNITFAKVIHLHQVSSFCSLSNVKTKKRSLFFWAKELVLAIFLLSFQMKFT